MEWADLVGSHIEGVTMLNTRALLLPVALGLAACGGGSSGGAGESPDSAANGGSPGASAPISEAPGYVLASDYDLASKVYDSSYSVPSGFFVDERAATPESYTVHHVMDETRSFEVCTDDYATAEAWEARDNDSRAVNGYFVSSIETERYYEFVRELAYDEDVGNITSPTSPGYARVFKCSNTSRDGVDRRELDGFAGYLNRAPRSANDVKVFAEYLWQFAFFPYRHKKVIDSVSSAGPESLSQTLVLGFAINQGTGRCDRIDIVEWAFSANRETGRVAQSFNVVKSFEARYESGVSVICD